MCRNITELRGLQPAATDEEIEAAARQYVRKVSGITRPSAANVDAFEAAVAEVTATTTRLLSALPPRRQPPKTVPPLRRPEVRGPAGEHDHRHTSRPALKEWSAAVHALLDGRQTVLLRKGGIGEKRFEVAAERVPVVPDGRAQPRRAGPARAPRPARAGGGRQRRRSRGAAGRRRMSLPHCRFNRRTDWPTIEDLHIWTAESVRDDRLDFRPRHRLTVLVGVGDPAG